MLTDLQNETTHHILSCQNKCLIREWKKKLFMLFVSQKRSSKCLQDKYGFPGFINSHEIPKTVMQKKYSSSVWEGYKFSSLYCDSGLYYKGICWNIIAFTNWALKTGSIYTLIGVTVCFLIWINKIILPSPTCLADLFSQRE